jgi:hypothetical protein
LYAWEAGAWAAWISGPAWEGAEWTEAAKARVVRCAAMNSDALKHRGFGAWHPMNAASEKALNAKLPSQPGVCTIRCCNPDRAMGPCDIMYIGKASDRGGLKL